MNEAVVLARIREAFATADASVIVGTGPDDCAWVHTNGRAPLAITTDTIVEGGHFRSADPMRDVGWKAVAVNLSDLAASGCAPGWGVAAVTLRRGMTEAQVGELIDGMAACARTYGLPLVGGDTTGVDGPLSLTLTVGGTPITGQPLLRSGARPGDVLVVTGALGGSLQGRHLRPQPRLLEIRCILECVPAHACMDLSDGLGLDLSRMMRESGCGATLEAACIPISPDIPTPSTDDPEAALAHALSDGEDFELLLALSPDAWDALAAAWPTDDGLAPLTRIGFVERETGMRLRSVTGTITPLRPGGFLHSF